MHEDKETAPAYPLIRWLGHATVRIDARIDSRADGDAGSSEIVVFIDPYDIKERAKSDIILISHEHFDHCSLDDLRKVAAKRTQLVGPPRTQSVLRRVTGHVHVLEPGEEIEVLGVPIRGVPAYNVEKEFHPKAAGGLGFVLELEGKRIYYAGDTDLIPEMKGLDVDIAILPVGGVYTMDATEAAEAFKLVGATEGVPIHYGSLIGTGADGEKFRRLIGA